jgi:N-acetylmuramoyl-L-alanine amidase
LEYRSQKLTAARKVEDAGVAFTGKASSRARMLLVRNRSSLNGHRFAAQRKALRDLFTRRAVSLLGYSSRYQRDFKVIRSQLLPFDNTERHSLDATELFVLVLEDRHFFGHKGFHLASLLRESLRALAGLRCGGASTVDMQYVRTCTGLRARTLRRKLYEILLSRQLYDEADKLQILRSYLDIAYFGVGVAGLEAAAARLYRTSVARLDADRSAKLAAMLLVPIPRYPDNRWRARVEIRRHYAQSVAPMALEILRREFRNLYNYDPFARTESLARHAVRFTVRDHNLVEDDGKFVEFAPSANHGGKITPRYIVLHATAGASFSTEVDWMCKPESKVSAHLVIGRNGEIAQLVPFDRAAIHAGKSSYRGTENLNSCSIGIEFSNFSHLQRDEAGKWKTWFGKEIPAREVVELTHKHEKEPRGWHRFSREQIEIAQKVILALQRAYGPLELLGHDDIAPGRKVDPGPAFPMERLRAVTKLREQQSGK